MAFLDLKAINEIHVEISSRCLLNCRHCSSYDVIHDGRPPFAFEDLQTFLKLFSENTHLYITGGEPLLSERLNSTLAVCRSCGMQAGLFTTFNVNAPLEPLMNSLKEQGVVDFYTSIYSADSAVHDCITRVKGSWETTVCAVKYAREVGISPKINFVIMRDNVDTLLSSLLKIDALGVDEIRILKLVNHGEATRNWTSLGVPAQEQYAAVEKILPRLGEFKARLTFSGFPKIQPCRPFESAYACGAGRTLLYIDNAGDIYPCASLKNDKKFKLGNIKRAADIQGVPLKKSNCLGKE